LYVIENGADFTLKDYEGNDIFHKNYFESLKNETKKYLLSIRDKQVKNTDATILTEVDEKMKLMKDVELLKDEIKKLTEEKNKLIQKIVNGMME